MRLALSSLFLTLVVLNTNAAPNMPVPPPAIQTRETFQNTNSASQKESVQATEPQPYDPRFIRRSTDVSTGSTNAGIGMASGSFNKDKDHKDLTTFHLQRTQYNSDETAQEFGLNLTSNGLVGIDWGFKKFCCFNSFAAEWKPFFKIGAAGFYEPKDQLANVIDYQRYFWQVGLGLEDPLTWHRQIRVETGVRAGYPGTHFYLLLLYAFPD